VQKRNIIVRGVIWYYVQKLNLKYAESRKNVNYVKGFEIPKHYLTLFVLTVFSIHILIGIIKEYNLCRNVLPSCSSFYTDTRSCAKPMCRCNSLLWKSICLQTIRVMSHPLSPVILSALLSLIPSINLKFIGSCIILIVE
jgi:hypothetical protein